MAANPKTKSISIWDPRIVQRATWDSLRKLDPRTMARNPVMFVVEVGSVLTTLRLIQDALAGRGGLGFELQITFWLWLTVLFANFAEAMAEGRGKAQADTLRKAKTEMANRRPPAGRSTWPRRGCARATSSASRGRRIPPTAASSIASVMKARSPANLLQ
jgi:K+-transporting ATPase ATPase B chain